MDRTQAFRGALEAVDRILNRGGDADDVLGAVVDVLRERVSYEWVGIALVEEGKLELGPSAGTLRGEPARLPVSFQGSKVAELRVAPGQTGDEEQAFLERVATLISAYCLVGWDTGGVPWRDLG